ncbi:hypothetical protein DBR25_05015 [Chryseobacterium sp. HMWF001]|nr:hypothetical protein DBR25_05015 [Chryseobacterium sp. HMWF001]
MIATTCSCLVFYLCLLLCHVCTTIFYFYVPIILLVLLISDIKTTAIVTIFIILLSAFTKNLAEFFNLSQPKSSSILNSEVLNYIEWIEVFIVSYLSFYILYYYNELKKIEATFASEVFHIQIQEDNPPIDKILKTITPPLPDQQDDKLDVLYQKIIDLFETQKPYQHSDFNLKKLADILYTNTTYVSKALNICGGKKFNQFVNEYRINQVKKEIENKIHQKFTLEHIYTNAGFSQQATFNRIFKEQTGLTPSEYIENRSRC